MTTSGEQDVAEDPLKPAMLAIAPALGSGMRITRWSTGRGVLEQWPIHVYRSQVESISILS